GEEEKITVLDAIKAVTIHSAYQYFEEKKKGSIKEGKLADLIIINKNPLKIEKDKIKDIKILETLKEGKVIFKKNN
ncbi:MAG TPA: amidohydrolase family protein, partial [Candidatus Merdicola faecigallinarum]|nr:amidohydrolase family protein [Candidatus Merdicola faecigallinarum]